MNRGMSIKSKRVSSVLLVALLSTFGQPPTVAATKCTSGEKIQYKKAKEQFINDNSIIYLANKIKAVIEDARKQKSDLLGRFVDYTAKDIYDLQKQDSSIASAEAHRDSWEVALRKLSIKCKLPMPSKTQLNPGTDSI
jgi:hypothetical protein